MKLLVAVWFLATAVAALLLPAFRGEIDGSARALGIAVFAAVAVAALAVARRRAATMREALVATLPAFGLIAATAVAGSVLAVRAADARGEPIFLFFGIALWASWAALVAASAAIARTRWSSLGGLGLTLAVSALGLFLVAAQID